MQSIHLSPARSARTPFVQRSNRCSNESPFFFAIAAAATPPPPPPPPRTGLEAAENDDAVDSAVAGEVGIDVITLLERSPPLSLSAPGFSSHLQPLLVALA